MKPEEIASEVREKARREPLELIRIEIDKLAALNLDPLALAGKLEPITKMLVNLEETLAIMAFDYMTDKLKLSKAVSRALKKEVAGIKANGSDQKKPTRCAFFSDLVDLVANEGVPRYLIKEGAELNIVDHFFNDQGERLVPPKAEQIPFRLVEAYAVIEEFNCSDDALYWDIFKKLKSVSVLPGEAEYHLCTVFIFFTYLSEKVPYYPILWFLGAPERGKSRITKAIIRLAFRGFYSETLNEAYIFRLAERFKITLAIDVFELTEQAKKRGSHDLLLNRFESGATVARVNPDKQAYEDITYYAIGGATIFATNKPIPESDPLLSRCIKIVMPEARGIYPNNNSEADLLPIKARLLAFRARHLEDSLPEVEKPVAGRLGDIIQPLLRVARLLPAAAFDAVNGMVFQLEQERQESEAESLSGKIIQAIYDLQGEMPDGRIRVELIRKKVNESMAEKYQYALQTIGRELSVLGVPRKKSMGKMHVVCEPNP